MKISLETEYETFTTEFKNIDVTVDQILDALKGMLVSATFAEETVISGMKDYLEQFPEAEDEAEMD